MKRSRIFLILGLASGLAGPAMAADFPLIERFSGTVLAFTPTGSFSRGTLSVAGPNGFAATVRSNGAAPALDLAQAPGFQDGEYRYQWTAATGRADPTIRSANDGRRANAPRTRLSVAMSGAFTVKGGRIVDPQTEPRARVVGGSRGDDQDN